MWLITLLIILLIIPLIILLILLLSLSASPFIPVLCKNIHINQSSGHQAQWDILLKGGVFMLNGVIAHQNKNMTIKLQYACERGIIIVAFNKLMGLNWRNCTTLQNFTRFLHVSIVQTLRSSSSPQYLPHCKSSISAGASGF